jgi:hypothetical protein
MPECLIQAQSAVPVDIGDSNSRGTAGPRGAMQVNRVSCIQKFSKRADALGKFCSQVFRVEVANSDPANCDAMRAVARLESLPIDLQIRFVFISLQIQYSVNAGPAEHFNVFAGSRVWANVKMLENFRAVH